MSVKLKGEKVEFNGTADKFHFSPFLFSQHIALQYLLLFMIRNMFLRQIFRGNLHFIACGGLIKTKDLCLRGYLRNFAKKLILFVDSV